ncbi:MAG: MoaD/ThiS family protein [Lachnospiraceae bacterium]|nr:MoaD/ThiS family protein [Lachnospiraceae bacterium]
MIQVHIYGVARLKAGVGSFETNVQTLEELKGILPGITRKEADDLVVFVNEKAVKKHYRFQDGDQVSFLAPAGGG